MFPHLPSLDTIEMALTDDAAADAILDIRKALVVMRIPNASSETTLKPGTKIKTPIFAKGAEVEICDMSLVAGVPYLKLANPPPKILRYLDRRAHEHFMIHSEIHNNDHHRRFAQLGDVPERFTSETLESSPRYGKEDGIYI